MIHSISLKNYKCFEQCSIEMRPITLLLGPNNSGKSAIISSVKLLAQTVESYDKNVPILLHGKYGDFGTYKDLVNKNITSKKMTIKIESSYKPSTLSVKDPERVSAHLTYSYKSSKKRVVLSNAIFFSNSIEQACFAWNEETEKYYLKSILGQEVDDHLTKKFKDRINFFHFLPNHMWYGEDQSSLSKKSKNQIRAIETLQPKLKQLYLSLSKLDYLSALRLPPSRTYSYSGELHKKIGASGENAMTIFAMNYTSKGRKGKAILEALTSWLGRSGIADSVAIRDIASRFFEIQIKHPSSDLPQNIADVGFGVSQVLPVLVGGMNCEANTSFLVEEPEIHLHPRAQAELGDFFVNLKERNVQVIAETHSEHLVLRLLQAVAQGKLNPSDVIFYSISTNRNGCNAEKVEVDSKGMFVGGWPQGFFPERLEEAKKLALAREA